MGVQKKNSQDNLQSSLEELQALVKTAGGITKKIFTQKLQKIHPGTFIGKGKMEEIKEYLQKEDIDIIVLDANLSPSQQTQLEVFFEKPILDRTAIILHIFAKHARTKEGALQVEFAQLEYRLPRLVGSKKYLSRLGGGIGTQGPGETQLEIDRRRIRQKMDSIKAELENVKRHREIYRSKRKGVPLPVVSLVGYTNAGKSTLLNCLCGKTVVKAQDKLFETLDPTTRKIKLKNNQAVLITDTVGFIEKLPHQLVEAFRATFEEVSESDLLIHVIDGSHPQFFKQAETVLKVLEELSLSHKPILHVYNKLDLYEDDKVRFLKHPKLFPSLILSAEKNINIEQLLEKLEEFLSSFVEEIEVELPLDEQAQKLRALISENGKILLEKVEHNTLKIKASVNKKIAHYLRNKVQ